MRKMEKKKENNRKDVEENKDEENKDMLIEIKKGMKNTGSYEKKEWSVKRKNRWMHERMNEKRMKRPHKLKERKISKSFRKKKMKARKNIFWIKKEILK